jgi:hypothetical protein
MGQNKENYDVAVIGAGPAGMMAAISAAESGAKVVLVERNKSAGKKLLLTGGGHCNLANAESDLRKLIANYGETGPFLFHAFAGFGPKDAVNFFNKLGVKTVVENNQRVFPKSGQAADVLDALLKYLESLNVRIIFGGRVAGIDRNGVLIKDVILDSGQAINAKNYIFATGGKSYPATGSAGDGYEWSCGLGHEIAPLSPGLVPVRTDEEWGKKLSGVSLENVGIAVRRDGAKVISMLGEILFTHFGLSGPAILNMSSEIGKLLDKGEVAISIDLFPQIDRVKIDKMILDNFKKNPNRVLKNCLADIMPQGLVLTVAGLANVAAGKTANNITKEERFRLLGAIKDIRLTVSGLLDIEAGMVTAGGVSLESIDDKTMRSKIVKNLFFAGEIINVHGRTGGFNLTQCWATGRLAGIGAIK